MQIELPSYQPIKEIGAGVVIRSNDIDSTNMDYWLKADRDKKNSLFRLEPIDQAELWACARLNGKGKFITYHVAEEAFRNEWVYTEPDSNDDDSLEEALDKKLQVIRKERKISEIHKRAVWLALAVGRAIAFKFPVRPRTKPKGEWEFRVAPISNSQIKYDADGRVEAFTPYLKIGKTKTQWVIPVDEASIYINMMDPDGNGYEGISELEGEYYALKWSSNILESWAELMNKRGLGLLDIEIAGADTPTLEKYKNQWGDPSQYSVIFHNEDWQIHSENAVSPQYNLDATLGVYTKEASSGANISKSRLDGDPMGATTASKTDQDNFGTRVGAVQKHYHNNCLELHHIADKSTLNAFDVKYDLSVKLDRAQEVDIFSVAVSAVNQGLDLLSYNQALRKLHMPPVKDGDMLASKWIATHQDYNDVIKEVPKEEATGNGSPMGAGPPPGADKSKQGAPYTINDKRNETEIKKDRDGLTRKELKVLKINAAKALYSATDSEGNRYSHTVVNSLLKTKFGSGLSFSDLVRVRESQRNP